jgi:hypothetical protein
LQEHRLGREIPYRRRKIEDKREAKSANFDCGNNLINNYIRLHFEEDTSSVSYIFENTEDGTMLGFVSVACSGIHKAAEKDRVTLPAIEIKYFALATKYQKLRFDETDEHYYLSDKILSEVINFCVEVKKYIGASAIVLYSVPDKVGFYARNGFTPFDEYMVPDTYYKIEGCIPMFMPLGDC